METENKSQLGMTVQLRTLVEEYVEARNLKDKLTEEKTKAEKMLAGKTENLIKHMADIGLKTANFDDLGSVRMRDPIPRPRYDKADEVAVWEWVTSNGGATIIKPTLNASSFSAFVAEQIGKGVPIPEFIEVYYQPAVTYDAAKKKTE